MTPADDILLRRVLVTAGCQLAVLLDTCVSCMKKSIKMPCVLQLSLRGNLGQYVMHISCRYQMQCTGNAIFGPVKQLTDL